jgi:hypothetical protein
MDIRGILRGPKGRGRGKTVIITNVTKVEASPGMKVVVGVKGDANP